jgi:hypothetical protein
VTQELTFRFFANEVSALGWLTRFGQERDAMWRLEGRQEEGIHPQLPSGASEWEQYVSRGFAEGAASLVDRALREDYQPDHARDLAAMVNGMLRHLRVEVCGYAPDVAHALRASTNLGQPASEQPSPFLQDLLYLSLGLDAQRVRHTLVEAGAYEVEPIAAQRCRARIGQDAWRSLSPESRWFLSAAMMQDVESDNHLRIDYAGFTIQLCRPLEFEVNQACRKARVVLANVEVDGDDSSPLARFLRGGRDLTLGELIHYLANKKDDDYDSPSAPAFRSALRELGLETLMAGGYLKKLRDLNQTVRRQAAHATPVTRRDADRCASLVLGDEETDGLLPVLARALQPDERPVIVACEPMMEGRRRLEPDHVAVSFTLDELIDRATRSDHHNVKAGASSETFITDAGVRLYERITPGLIVCKPENGLVYLSALILGRDDVLDIVVRTWVGDTVRKLDRALSREVVNWRHRDGTEVFSDRSTGGLRLRFHLDAGAASLGLDVQASKAFRSAIAGICAGKWGHVHEHRTPSDTNAAAEEVVETLWNEMAVERAKRARS